MAALNKMELKHELESKYSHTQAMLKRIECVYIPVTNAAAAKRFFMKHGLVTLSPGGNVKLASGQGLFFLETREKQSPNFVTHDWDEDNEAHEMEAICFEVTAIHELHRRMKDNGAMVSELKDSGGCGLGFYFFDPDGNKYAAWQDV
ncbi:VOC family protein [Paenibacillus lycopersici]|uniref:VOC family protein n=1 Tax=Paenibacillus lycopersici TaxID=2704462 RepID=A0A6C0FWI7_9BACL|nr:VOC family protein [Paenibacillus lycopersici]QHT59823.1 VOC family protein [Paenibacillus lycopersici]